MSAKKEESLKDITNEGSPSGSGNTRRSRRNRKSVDKNWKESPQAAFVAAELPDGGFVGLGKARTPTPRRKKPQDKLPGIAPRGGLQEANLLLKNRPDLMISVTPPTPGNAPLPRTPLNKGARGRGAGGSQAGRGGGVGRGGRGGGVKREREPANQVANQSQVDIIDPNHVKNEADQENNEVEVTYESHPNTMEAIEAREAVTKLMVLKQKKRKLEMEKMKLQEEEQDLDAKIEEAREEVAKI